MPSTAAVETSSAAARFLPNEEEEGTGSLSEGEGFVTFVNIVGVVDVAITVIKNVVDDVTINNNKIYS